MKHNFYSYLLIVAGGGVIELHYATLQKKGGCPVVIAYGPSETGKSTSISVVLSMLGKHDFHRIYIAFNVVIAIGSRHSIYERGTNVSFLDKAQHCLSALMILPNPVPKGVI